MIERYLMEKKEWQSLHEQGYHFAYDDCNLAEIEHYAISGQRKTPNLAIRGEMTFRSNSCVYPAFRAWRKEILLADRWKMTSFCPSTKVSLQVSGETVGAYKGLYPSK